MPDSITLICKVYRIMAGLSWRGTYEAGRVSQDHSRELSRGTTKQGLDCRGTTKDTRHWWRALENYEIVSSELAVQELSAGEPAWALRRLALLETVPIVAMNDEAEQIALELVSRRVIPLKAKADAFHIALAATNGVEFMLTWNFKHLANAMLRRKINEVCEDYGYIPIVICTPNELLGEEPPDV